MKTSSFAVLAALVLGGCAKHPVTTSLSLARRVSAHLELADGRLHYRAVAAPPGLLRSDAWLGPDVLEVENQPDGGALYHRRMRLDADAQANVAIAFQLLRERYGDVARLDLEILEDGGEIAVLGAGTSRVEIVSLDSPVGDFMHAVVMAMAERRPEQYLARTPSGGGRVRYGNRNLAPRSGSRH